MKSLKLIICFIMASIFLMSCSEKYKSQEIQQIYFEHYSVNNAWGFYYDHWIIDSDGNVRAIRDPESVIQIDPVDLNSYLSYFDTVLFKIDALELSEYVDLIKDAASGQIDSEPRDRRDYGQTVYNCYSPEDGRYKTVLLSEESDSWTKLNLDSHARVLDNWLKRLDEDLIK